MIYKKKCKICGKEFETDKSNKTICNNKHYAKCYICGKEFELKKYSISKYLKGYQFTCSKKCATESMKRTNLKKYGNKCSAQNKEIRENILLKFNEKYGGDSPFCSNAIQKKGLQKRNNKSNKEKELIKQKVKQTNLERYGDENYNNPDKFKETMQERYKVNYTNESSVLKRKQQNTMKERYGVSSSFDNGIIRDKINKIILNKYGIKGFISSTKTINTCMQRYGVPYYCMTEECRRLAHTPISQNNLKLKESLEKLGNKVELEYVIENLQYDLKVDNTLIEINPTFTHNSYIGPKFSEDSIGKPKDKDYHINKTKLAETHGFKCIHIFDWDNKEKIINLFCKKEYIYARKCKIKIINKEECDKFLNEYHLQNTCKGQSIKLGLYYNNKLVQVITFGKPRYNKNYEYELLRLCTHKDYKIIGGSQKLFNYFIKNYNSVSIISYCDLSKFEGNVYKKLGFRLKNKTGPALHWSKYNKQITNNLLLQRGYDQLFGTNYGKGTSNQELMLKDNWLPVYDCGQAIYIYEDKNI